MSWIARTNPFLYTVIEKEEAANTTAGFEDYSHHLIKLLAGDRAGKANAEQATRDGKRGYVSETAIAEAFNDLMRKVQGRDGAEIRTSAEDVHRMRGWDDRISPALSSVETHPSACLPGEAMFTLVMLLNNNGAAGPAPARPLSDKPPAKPGRLEIRTVSGRQNAQGLLDRYVNTHWRWQTASLYGRVLKDMGI